MSEISREELTEYFHLREENIVLRKRLYEHTDCGMGRKHWKGVTYIVGDETFNVHASDESKCHGENCGLTELEIANRRREQTMPGYREAINEWLE